MLQLNDNCLNRTLFFWFEEAACASLKTGDLLRQLLSLQKSSFPQLSGGDAIIYLVAGRENGCNASWPCERRHLVASL